MKLESDIRNELYHYIKGTALSSNISGRLFKYDEERPGDSSAEDIVIAVLTDPNFNDVQEIIVIVRVYVSDLFDSDYNIYRENGIRLAELQKLCLKAFKVFRTKESRCSLESMKTFKVEAKNEHCIVNRINYKYCNY